MAIFGALAKKGKEPSAPRKIAYGMLVAAIGFAVMAFGSKDLNTPDQQAKAIAVTNGIKFSEEQFKLIGTDKIDEVLKQDGLDAELKKNLEGLQKKQNEYIDKLTKAEKTADIELYNETFATNISVLSNTDENGAVVGQGLEDMKSLQALKDEHKETRTSSYWLIFTYLILTFAELLLSPMGISFVSKVAPPKYKGMMMGGWFVATAIGNLLVAVGGFLWAGLPLWSVWAVFVGLCLISAIFMFAMMKRLEKATR
jgi:MFS family permease